MPRRHLARIAALVSLLLASAPGQEQRIGVEFILFSGRARPAALIADPAHMRAILDSLDTRAALAIPCAEIPPLGSTPSYTGVLLTFSVAVLERKTLAISRGYISYDTAKPCYRDPGQRLEKLAVETAFRYDDVNAPGGARPMPYLACLVPETLHPEIAPCTTATAVKRSPRVPGRSAVPAHSRDADRVFTLDGRPLWSRRPWTFPVFHPPDLE